MVVTGRWMLNRAELVERIRSVIPPDGVGVGYYLSWGEPSAAMVSLIPGPDGTFTATEGDMRDRIVPVEDAPGHRRVFADESAACEWAWQIIRAARTPAPEVSAEQAERDRLASADVTARWEERVRQWQLRPSGGPEGETPADGPRSS